MVWIYKGLFIVPDPAGDDYDASERIEITEEEARGLEVKCLYIEDGELWIEVSRE